MKFSKFYQKTLTERRALIQNQRKLSPNELEILSHHSYIPESSLDLMVENVVGYYPLPYSIVPNFLVNQKEYLVPMVIEESSVVAAASKAAKIARIHGGFTSEPVESLMIGQIQIYDINSEQERKQILEFITHNKQRLIEYLDFQDPTLVSHQGGVKDIQVREISTDEGYYMILHVIVDVRDAMGANIVNTMVERLAAQIEPDIPGKINLRIISNLAIHRVAKVRAIFDKEAVGGSKIVAKIIKAYQFARDDPFRATTHNKGIMNGIDAVAIATGNDFRALEAGAHAFASLSGQYHPLTRYYLHPEGHLIGEIKIPLAMGVVGGLISKHPGAKLSLKIMDVYTAEELCQVTAAVGLAQNFAALRALADEGIQQGHMKLHSRIKDHTYQSTD
ncbi:MAG: hydroxymethylglutaryl-CoA reductase, degradative [Promethearchaeia archaeon]|nr:MAG: hydroxymethylglutaryl-CoA reductase, degradative [Candidatus Lokiarchaeia archaeon]